MAVDKSGKWLGLGVGDVDDPNTPRNAPNWHAIDLLTQKLHGKFTWARTMGVVEQSSYDATVAAAVGQYCTNKGLPVVLDANGQPVANLATRTALGSYPPPAPPRHGILTYRGTGGVIGLDYTSIIAQACSDVVEEFPMDYSATIGPVGGDPLSQSGNAAVAQALDLTEGWLHANPTRSFILDGYSLGAICASHVRNELEPGGRFAQFRPNYVAGVTLGNPSRRFGHTYYLGLVPPGEGISDYSMGPFVDREWQWCDLAHPDDFYTDVHPLGDVVAICRAVYSMVMSSSVSDPLTTIAAIIPGLIQLVQDALGANELQNIGGLAGLFGALGGSSAGGLGALGGIGGILALLPMLTALIGHPQVQAAVNTTPVPGSGGLSVGPIAAIQAAVLAIQFFASGTAAHVQYHVNEVWPGQTYLGLGIQHVHDWATRTPVTT
jgi:hypothetical protein